MHKKTGVSLIVLVIVVIVTIILASVAIISLKNNGIIKRTGMAVNNYNTKQVEEQIKLAYLEYKLSQYSGASENASDFIKNRLNSSVGNVDDVSAEGNAVIVTICKNDQDKTYYYNVKEGTVKQIELVKNSTSKNDSYVGCYADIDEDGIVDGVIFADLLTGSIRETQQWARFAGNYTLSQDITSTNTRIYYISQDSYMDSYFESHPVISPIQYEGTKRFYIMSLSDFKSDAYTDPDDETQSYNSFTIYTWYNKCTEGIDESEISWEFGAGKTNTRIMIDRWNNNIYGEHDNQDIWKHIQISAQKGWFIPSNAEWSAFINELRDYKRKLSQKIWTTE